MSSKWSACAVLCVVTWFGARLTCPGQSDPKPKNKIRAERSVQLAIVDNVVVKSEAAQSFVEPIHCDNDGNVYLMSDVDATSGMEAGDDGNIYLMCRLSPAIVYAISPGGGVVQHFTIDPGNADSMPISMHMAAGKIAVLFASLRPAKN